MSASRKRQMKEARDAKAKQNGGATDLLSSRVAKKPRQQVDIYGSGHQRQQQTEGQTVSYLKLSALRNKKTSFAHTRTF
jgi:hypothetical protein